MSFKSKLSRLEQIAQINPMRRVTKGVQVPFVEMAALSQNFRDIQRSDVEFRVAKSAGAHFKNGDTLLARITPCLENGKTAKVNCLDENVVGEGSTEFIVLCGIYPEDDDYVYYLCRDPEFRKYAIGRMEGTSGRQRVSWQSIAAYEYLPTLPNERRASAKILAALDDRIALLRETNVTLEAIAQALFKSWFVDFDPVRAKSEGKLPEGIDEATAALFPDSFEQSELGKIPKGWKIQSLNDIANYLNGLALQKFPPTGKDDLPVIKIAQLRKDNTIGADMAFNGIKEEYIIKDGDILFSWSGSLEVVIWCGGIGALNQHLFKVSSDYYQKWFYYLWTKHHLEKFRQIAASKATTMGHIQRHHLVEAKVIIPNKNILNIADKIFTPLLDKIILNSIQIRNLSNIRDILLPRLISGQITLPEVKEEINSQTKVNVQ